MKLCNACYNKQRNSMSGQAFTSFQCAECGTQSSHANTGVPKICHNCADKYQMCQKCGDLLTNKQRFSLYIEKNGLRIVSNMELYEFSFKDEKETFEKLKTTKLQLTNDVHSLRHQLLLNWAELVDFIDEIQELEEFQTWKTNKILKEL